MAKRASEQSGFKTGTPPAGRITAVVISVLLFATVFGVFFPCLQAEFVNFDDDVYVFDNARVGHGLTWDNITWAFTTLEAGFWHPLTWCSFFLDEQIHGMRSAGYHLTNILLHGLNTVLLFAWLRRATGAVWRSAFVAALFALHPLHVEPVAWVASRKDVLSTLFWMLSLFSYVQYAQGRESEKFTEDKTPASFRVPLLYGLSFFFFACGLMSKTMVVTLPLILFLLDWWPLRRFPHDGYALTKRQWIRLGLEKVPFLAAAFVCGLLTVHAEKKVGAMVEVSGIPLIFRLENATLNFARYLVQMIWPAGMAPFYPYPKVFPLEWVLAAAALLVAITVLVLLGSRRHLFLGFGWFWYVVTLLPVCGLIQVGSHARADRYTYVPLIGIFVLIGWGAYEITKRLPRQAAVLWAAAAAVLLACVVQTRVQIGRWQDSETLFRHTLAVTRENHFAHNNLGLALMQKGGVDAAILEFNAAIKIEPDYAKPHNNLGIALLEKGSTTNAIAEFQTALKSREGFAEVRYNLGVAWLRNGQPQAALGEFQKAVDGRPDLPKARYGLGSALLRTGRTDEAVVQFARALELDPAYADAHSDYGLALLRQGKVDEAIVQFREALAARPDTREAAYNLGLALLRKGSPNEAIPPLEKAVSLEPGFVEARNELATALLRTGRSEDAIAQFEKVVQANPNLASARNDLAGALVQRGRIAEALSHYEVARVVQPENPMVLNNIAWILATSPDAKLRDGNRSLDLARKADQITGGKDPSVLETLAAALAETGSFSNAAVIAQRALELAGARSKPVGVDSLRAQLELYRAGQPYRDPALTKAPPRTP